MRERERERERENANLVGSRVAQPKEKVEEGRAVVAASAAARLALVLIVGA